MATAQRVKFIVIESLDAGGSSTQAQALQRHLKREGFAPQLLHFPQEDRATGRMIYDKFLLTKNKGKFTRREQALLYIQDFYSQAEAIARVQKQKGRSLVISDRWCTSTMAYQTLGLGGKKWDEMYQWIWWLCYGDTPQLPQPDLVIFIDTPTEVSMKRLDKKQADFFEKQEKLELIRRNYLKIAAKQGWHSVSSVTADRQERTRQAIHRDIWDLVN